MRSSRSRPSRPSTTSTSASSPRSSASRSTRSTSSASWPVMRTSSSSARRARWRSALPLRRRRAGAESTTALWPISSPRSTTAGARTPPQDPHLSLAPGHRRDRLCRSEAPCSSSNFNRRYERASITSNKGFEEWGQILGDEVMAAALIDRLLHHCHIVNIRGSSYRMRKHSTFPRSYTRLLRSRALYPPREREQEQRRSRRTRGSSPPPGAPVHRL